MLKITTREWDFGKIINISNDENSLEILYGGNGDLYFSPDIHGLKLYEMEDSIQFVITECDSEIYPLFDKLYQKITTYDSYDREDDSYKEEDIEYERKLDSYREFPLVHDGIISWHSDEDAIDQASVLNIKRQNDNILLEFKKSHPEEKIYMTYSIRFRNSGSRYHPFNFRFMELYNELCKIDFSYHQVTIQEYIHELQCNKRRILTKNKTN